MRINYQYRLLPTYQQRCRMDKWLDMLRCQYNWLLSERFDWWTMNRCSVNVCPLTCSIAEPRERPEYYGQKRSLVLLKGVVQTKVTPQVESQKLKALTHKDLKDLLSSKSVTLIPRFLNHAFLNKSASGTKIFMPMCYKIW